MTSRENVTSKPSKERINKLKAKMVSLVFKLIQDVFMFICAPYILCHAIEILFGRHIDVTWQVWLNIQAVMYIIHYKIARQPVDGSSK